MKIKPAILFLLISLISCQAYSATKNYYIELKRSHIEVGEYSKRYHKKVLKTFPEDQFDYAAISKLLLSDTSERILFYFHSMWGGNQVYHSNSLKKLNKIEGLDKMISIVWHTEKLGYKGSWKAALNQGKAFGELFEYLSTKAGHKNYVLCHSMGHRIFEGSMMESDTTNPRFEAVFFAAADLDMDVFSKNLNNLQKVSKRTIVYFNRKDRLLQISKIVLGIDRLSLNPDKYHNDLKSIENLELVDITQSKSGNFLSFSNHIYFKDHQGVRNDIAWIINEKSSNRNGHLRQMEANFFKMK